MTQQVIGDGQREVTGLFLLHDSTQLLSVHLHGSKEKQAEHTRRHQPTRWPRANHARDIANVASNYQQREQRKELKKIRKADIWQFLRFCVVGTSNAMIDFLILNLLLWVYPTGDTWRVLSYNSLAVLLAATNSFFWNKYWTFQHRNPITRHEVFRFAIVAGGTVLMNDVLMWLLSKLFPDLLRSSLIGANVLKLSAIIGTMSISFFGMRLWVFFQSRHASPSANSAEARLLIDQETVKCSIVHVHTNIDTAKNNQLRDDQAILEKPVVTYASNVHSNTLRRQHTMKTLIIIPTYNEAENLPLLLKEIFSFAPQTDVLIVDDHSPDGTGQLAEEIRKKNASVYVMHRPGKLGLGTAYIAGFQYALEHGYDAAFEMDADFSHDPRYLPDFLTAIEHADVVIGSRYILGGSTPNWSVIRRLISGNGNIFARFMLGIPVHDCTGGFRCYRRTVLQSIDLETILSRGYAFQVELTYRVMRQGFKIVETPITFMDRRLGKSKMSRKIVIEAFTWVLRTRFNKQPAMHTPTGLQSKGQTSGTAIHDMQQGELSFAATKLISRPGQASLSSIRPVKLQPFQ